MDETTVKLNKPKKEEASLTIKGSADPKNEREQLAYLREKIAAAEKLKNETQTEIKKYLRIPYENLQTDITKLIYFCNHLEKENKKLCSDLATISRQNFDQIDCIKDSVRRLSLVETEIECQVQKLRMRITRVEDTNERHENFIKSIDENFTVSDLVTVKELEKQIAPLEAECKNLENKLFEVKRVQEELSSTLQHKERSLKIERTQQESDIKRITASVEYMDHFRREIQERIRQEKAKTKQNSIKEIKKMSKLTSVWRELAEKHRNIFKEKMVVENENFYLKEKIAKFSPIEDDDYSDEIL